MLELADEWDLPMLTNSYISVYHGRDAPPRYPLIRAAPYR